MAVVKKRPNKLFLGSFKSLLKKHLVFATGKKNTLCINSQCRVFCCRIRRDDKNVPTENAIIE